MREEIRAYLESVDEIGAVELRAMIDYFGKNEVMTSVRVYVENIEKSYINLFDDNLDSEDIMDRFYRVQKRIWDKFGYCLAVLHYYPFAEQILKRFEKVVIPRQEKVPFGWNRLSHKFPILSLEEEVQYGFQLLYKNYIRIFLNPDKDDVTLDIYRIFSSIKTIGVRDIILKKFGDFYRNCSRVSNFDTNMKNFLRDYEVLCQKEEFPNLENMNLSFWNQGNHGTKEIMDEKVLVEQIELYLTYSIARDKFTNGNLKLIGAFSNKYDLGYSIDQDDIFQFGYLGLLKAVQSFDIRYGYKFSNYASYKIIGAITRARENYSRMIRIPVYVHEIISKIEKLNNMYYLENGSELTIKELALILDVKTERLKEILIDVINSNCVSFFEGGCVATDIDSLKDYGSDSCDSSYGDYIFVPSIDSFEDECIFRIHFQEMFKIMEQILSEKELEVLVKIFGIHQEESVTARRVAQEFGCSPQRIGARYKRALEKLGKNKVMQRFNPFL